MEQTEAHISSMMDAWLLVGNINANGERNRILYILKSRGMAHSNQVSEFEITAQGIHLVEAYLGKSGVLTGSARLAQEASEHEEEMAHQQVIELLQFQLERKRAAMNARIAALQTELEVDNAETQLLIDQNTRRKTASQKSSDAMRRKRQATAADNHHLMHTVEGTNLDE